MENDFRIKKINAKDEVEFHSKGTNAIETQLDKFISTLDAKKSKTEQNWADITFDSDNAEDELEIL